MWIRLNSLFKRRFGHFTFSKNKQPKRALYKCSALISGFILFPAALSWMENHIVMAVEQEKVTKKDKKEKKNPNEEISLSLERMKEIVGLASGIIEAQKQIQQEMQEDQKEGNNTPVYRIVLTGGPCGGKSTAMATISDRLLSLGFRVFRIPESATLLITGTGLSPGNLHDNERTTFEGSIIKTKIALEDIFYQIAKASETPSVIICDRGTMDTRAYMDEGSWEVLLDEFSWNVIDLRDKRYDAVIHMVTAAIGADKFYTTENNAARSENLNEARDLDFKVLNAWVGHPRIRIIDNSTDFKRKIQRVEEVICQIVGAPRPAQTERKFIVSGEVSPEVAENLNVKFETVYTEQTYLQPGKQFSPGYNYIRRRGQNGTYTYTHSMVRRAEFTGGQEEETAILERAISGREYIALLKGADPKRCTVTKKVQCFLWNNIYYELQTFIKPDVGLSILKTEVEPNQNVAFPWFLTIKGEITGLPVFSSYYIAEHYNLLNQKVSWKQNQELASSYYNVKRAEREKKLKKETKWLSKKEETEQSMFDTTTEQSMFDTTTEQSLFDTTTDDQSLFDSTGREKTEFVDENNSNK